MEKQTHPNNSRLNTQLPTHSPDPGTWQRIVSRLDTMESEGTYFEKLEQLPTHKPDEGTWAAILVRLNRAAYLKTGIRVALAAAAGLLLFFTVSQFVDYKQNTMIPHPGISQMKNSLPENSDQATIQNPPAGNMAQSTSESPRRNRDESVITNKTSENREYNPVILQVNTSAQEMSAENKRTDFIEIFPLEMLIHYPLNHSEAKRLLSLRNRDLQPALASLPAKTESKPAPEKKYYTPKEAKPGAARNNFALAMDYLPENVNNGTDNSLFHNVDLTASYNKEKVRFNTSVGMAYNTEQLEFDVNYDQMRPVMSIGPNGHTDTIMYEITNVDSEFQGTDNHKYFTYNLGMGRKLFTIGRFSTWLNAGAGFAVKLNNPNLAESTEKTLKVKYNADVNSISISQPTYNDMNINFVTGIDFNCRVFNHLSLTFTPTSRWYFKPVLTKDNKPTDELTLGFKTGMKFDF